MDLVWIKLILTPLAITAIALAGRRWGPAVGGWIAGLPLTSGPVSLYLALAVTVNGFSLRGIHGNI
jgi:hypothetical protein